MGYGIRRSPLLAAISVLAIFLAGCGSSSPLRPRAFAGTGYPGADLASARLAEGEIDADNVSSLEVAWRLPIEGASVYGTYASTPIVFHGVVYSQDLASNVRAIDLKTGRVLWTRSYESQSYGPNGLAVVGDYVYGATVSSAFALNRKTGKEVWSTRLVRGSHEGIDMAPGVDDGRVYLSTVPLVPGVDYPPGDVGVLWALNAKTGKKLWHFDTVPRGLWGHPDENSGGGSWYPPSFDEAGKVYIGVGNAGPIPGTQGLPWGSSRPGRNLYTDSMLKLDPETGKLIWFYQQTPHDVYDWDFQDSPVLAKAGGKSLAIGAGKSGIVVALDTETGKPVWKTSVGKHNGHDDDGLYAMRHEYSKIGSGTAYPGLFGGVIAPMATDGAMLYVPVINHPMTIYGGTGVGEGTGERSEIVALDLATGKEEWSRPAPGLAYGALTVINDLVFATTSGGEIHALKTDDGEEVWRGSLPAGSNAGVTVSGEMLVTGAGLPTKDKKTPQLVAYKLGG